MVAKPEVFLDTSALFAAIWSTTGGGRMLLKLGEAEAIQLLVSSQVLTEMEDVLRRKAPKKIVNAVPFPLGTPGDFLAWYRTQLV